MILFILKVRVSNVELFLSVGVFCIFHVLEKLFNLLKVRLDNINVSLVSNYNRNHAI